MNNFRFGSVAVLVVLAACAQDMPFTGTVRAADKFNPVVDVTGGKISIDQETITFGPDEKNVKITWKLAKDNFRFPADGIVFASGGAEFSHCGPQANGQRFSCVNLHTKKGTYKYTINVTDQQGKKLSPLDPIVQND